MIVGIDASNLTRGGGLTHLTEMILELEPSKHNFHKIIIWGSQNTLKRLMNVSWLTKVSPKELDKGSIFRFFWRRFKLAPQARFYECDLLLIPGGSFSCSFVPIVTMSRNMLPFKWSEAKRYGLSFTTLRMILLRFFQTKSFQTADGVIFLNDYAKRQVTKITGELPGKNAIIPHGLNERFQIEPKAQYEISNYNYENPYELLYVSIVDQYKHQWHVVDAVAKLRNKGYPVELNLVGPSYPASLKRLLNKLNMLDNKRKFIKYHGSIPYEELHDIYNKSHLAIFASSCENMPNILLEKMASGLPIACSNMGPMPEILGDGGLYFNPEDSNEIFKTLESLITNPQLRGKKARISFESVKKYSWSSCTQETFSFLETVLKDHKKSICVE